MPEKRKIPLLPLRGMIVFPYMLIHLDAGRKRSAAALERAMADDRQIFLCAQKDEATEWPTKADLYSVGTIAEVRQILKMPDGAFRVLVEGKQRAKLSGIRKLAAYDSATVECYTDEIDNSMEMEALTRSVVTKFEEWVKLTHRIPAEALISVAILDDAGRLADMIAAHLNLKMEDKQSLIDKIDVRERLEELYLLLNHEMEVLALERKIGGRVRKKIEKGQKEYYLREKIKEIRKELGDVDGKEADADEYRERLESGDYPEIVAETVKKEIGRLITASRFSAETGVIRTYIEWLLDLPWNESTNAEIDIKKAARILDEDHYGLKKVKERILDYLAVQQLMQSQHEEELLKAPILCLVGPPGVGKTSLAASVARAMGRKFIRASLGGIRDEAEIRGHRRTYVGALPGRIIDGLKRVATNDPVFLLDEVDKLGADYHGDPSAALLEVLDPAQNNTFTDHYIDLPFDLSKVFWIVTANDLGGIPRALRDRMEIIELSSYTEQEKTAIGKRYLFPRQCKENGLPEGSLTLANGVIQHIINEYTRESGVRELERLLGKLCRKTARRMVEKKVDKVHVRPSDLSEFLERPKYPSTPPEKEPQVGLVNGMAWTEVGGTTLPTEAAVIKGNGRLILTGKLGDVMQESAKAALSYIRSRVKEFNLQANFYEKYDIHVHLPEGAVPKDGPSAGITMATAMISALTNKKVRGDIAMTGEITLRGRVLPIGGLKEKVLAAYREGIRTIILPKKNERDIEDIPETVRRHLTFHPVETMDEVLKYVWVNE